MSTPVSRNDNLSDWSEVWQLVGGLLLHLMLCSLLIAALGLLASNAHADDETGLDEVSHGTLLFAGDAPERFHQAPLLHTDVTIDVSGMIVRARVRQTFKNDGDNWVEGIYAFPLPEDAAVDHMRMEIGTRVIEGKIKERQAARRQYEQAKRAGKKASLIEQERPNLFTNSVANIGPHENVVIEIEYQQVLRYDAGEFTLRFPMAITPRYIPGAPIARFSGLGWALDTPQVPDASRITPPVWHGEGKVNPVSLTLHLNAGFPLAKLESPYHPIKHSDVDSDKGIVTITLADGQVFAERDFELRWAAASGHAPRAALFSEQVGAEFYHLLMVMPPQSENQTEQRLAREVIYIIDTSGSMAGVSIRQAKQALLLALERLRPGDRFNVISFNSTTDQLFSNAVPANSYNLRRAHSYVNGLHAGGGTEMLPALEAALEQEEEQSSGVRQIIFLTDGAVGNEAALLNLIHKQLGNSRLFTVGIGAAPNSHFMSKAAEFGRGSFTYIGDVTQVQNRMAALFQKLETPLMTDLGIDSGNAPMEMYPPRLPDLYQGQPLLISFKDDGSLTSLRLSGRRQQQTWQNTIQLDNTTLGKGIGTLWARRKIAALMDDGYRGADRQEIRQQIVNVALQHHLVSKYTSLVAVDVTPSRPGSEGLEQHVMPVNLPHGQVYEKIFGHHARTATSAPLNLLLGALLLLSALFFQQRKGGLK